MMHNTKPYKNSYKPFNYDIEWTEDLCSLLKFLKQANLS